MFVFINAGWCWGNSMTMYPTILLWKCIFYDIEARFDFFVILLHFKKHSSMWLVTQKLLFFLFYKTLSFTGYWYYTSYYFHKHEISFNRYLWHQFVSRTLRLPHIYPGTLYCYHIVLFPVLPFYSFFCFAVCFFCLVSTLCVCI